MNSPTQTLPKYLNYCTPAVFLSFDDGRSSVYSQAFAYMQTKSIKGTAYIITDNVGDAGYMSEAQLIGMDAAGWDIANHTTDHTILTTLETQEAIQAKLTGAQGYLDGIGLTRASRHVAYPYGSYTDGGLVLPAMTAAGMLSGRCVEEELFWIGDEYAGAPYTLPAFNIDFNDSLEEAKTYLDSAIAQGKVASLYFHDLVEADPGLTEWLISDFQALIDYINEIGMPSLTITQLYTLSSGSLAYTNPWYTG